MDTIFASIISALGGLLSAVVTALATRRLDTKLRLVIVVVAVLVVAALAFVAGLSAGPSLFPTPTPTTAPTPTVTRTPTITPTPDPCTSAKITDPKGAKLKNDAVLFPVTATVQIVWDLAGCAMTVDYYQAGTQIEKIKGVKSGDSITLKIDKKGERAIEIKIWREGETKQSDYIWVLVRD